MSENDSKDYKKESDLWGDVQTYKGVEFYPIKIRDTKQ
jgi:hypothetical protein